MEDKKLKIELDAVKDAYQQRVIKNKVVGRSIKAI